MRSFPLMKRGVIRRASVAFVWALSCAISAYGQLPDCPRPPMEELARLAGAWTVTLDYRLEGELIRADSASAQIELAAGNCALIEKLYASVRGQSLAMATILVAPTPETLERAYVDSFHGGLSVFHGQARRDTVRLERSQDWGTHIQLVQHDYFGIEADAFATETRMSPDNGEHWILVQRAVYRRHP